MMQLRLGISAALLSALAMTGCSTLSTKLAVDNGSLNYKKAENIESLKYPQGIEPREATPLYPAPIINPVALEKAPDFENQKGNRFAMPRPLEQVQNRSAAKKLQKQYDRPTVLFDSTRNPLLKVSGKSDTIWQYTLATLSSLNYSVSGQNPTRYEATIQVNQKTYLLKLSAVGKENTLVLFNPDNSFADQAQAEELLGQIATNWPA